MTWGAFSLDGFSLYYKNIGVVLVCYGSDLHTPALQGSFRGRLLMEGEFWLF